MIVATAGHIDHGKTSLVRALTGTDTDRLPEEKARGITIDLGFAYLPEPGGGSIGFVDVPGHERLVRTMMAGASGVDLALLVVAADDGIMPQTREHLAVLDLLGIERGIVALTKADRVDGARLARLAADIRATLAGTGLAHAPVVPCSSVTGDGIPAITRHLFEAATVTQARGAAGHFRLAVDRSFSLPGIGLIVTGTVHAGRVAVGDRLLLSPAGIEARVRGLHAQNRAQTSGAVGQRVALNIATRAGKGAIHRGDWVVAPAVHAPTARLDARIRLLPAEARALKHWTPVHLHLGAASVTGRVALLEAPSLAPGAAAFAQIVLDAPIGALRGDRFALRDASAQRTIGGGHVLDPFAALRRGRTPERIATLTALAHPDPADALRALLNATPGGVDADRFDLARNIADPSALAGVRVVVEATAPKRALAFAPDRWQAIQAALLDGVARAQHAGSWGVTNEEAQAALDPAARPVAGAAIRALVEAGGLARTGFLLHLPGREITLAADDQLLWDRLRDVLAGAGLDPPRLGFLAERLAVDEAVLRALAERLGRIGWLHVVSAAYVILPETAGRFADEARRVAANDPERLLTVGSFRKATGTGRHATMPILEFFDRTGLTRRVPEGRRVSEVAPESNVA